MASSPIDRRQREDRHKPRKPGAGIDTRKELFAALNAWISKRDGFVTSIPGAPTVTFEVLPDSSIPQELIELGWDVVPADPASGERVLAHAIETRLTRNADGTLGPLTEGSTQAVALVQSHAGIVTVRRYSFAI